MAKKTKNDDDFFAQLAETTGGQLLKDVGKVPYFIDSGNLAINYICSGKFVGGGFPGGKIIEAYGPEASAKSLLGYCFLGGVQRLNGIAVNIDCEHAANAEFAEAAGHVDSSKLLAYENWFALEDVEENTQSVVKTIREIKGNEIPIGFMWDSITVNPTRREWAVTKLPAKPTKTQLEAIGADRPGERAKAAGDALRILNPFLSQNAATLYIINQTRSKIGVNKWENPTTTGGGGMALRFYASCRLETRAAKTILDAERKIPIGVNLAIKNKKSRCFTPGLQTKEIQLYYANGINPLGGLLSILIGAGRVEGKGSYQVLEPWANGLTTKFKASVERNDIPLEVVYDYPALVDATSKEEVENYLAPHMDAFQLSGSKNIAEIATNPEESIEDMFTKGDED